VTGVSLYLLAPSITEVFQAWDQLGRLNPLWVLAALVCGIASFACMWVVQAIALGSTAWFAVITTQLAGNAFNRITPGGGATGTALQARMLSDAGMDTARAATALTAQSLLSSVAVFALPVFSLPAIVLGADVPHGLLEALWIGLPVFVLTAAFGIAMLVFDAPLRWLGCVIEAGQHAARRRRARRRRMRVERPRHDLAGLAGNEDCALGQQLLGARDDIRAAIEPRLGLAVGASIGRWLFEYALLLVVLYGVGASPDPSLVLLAFVAAALLGLLPFTPGGLGFVEAGLTATLALAGIPADAALLATLVYRLITFWLPLPLGAGAAWLFRRRYPRRSPRRGQRVGITSETGDRATAGRGSGSEVA
jgi:hypothetical protein